MKVKVQSLLDTCIQKFSVLEECRKELISSFEILVNCYKNEGKVLVCGNGGSASDADHIVGELMKKFRIKRPVEPAFRERLLSLGYDFAEHLASKLERGLPAISLVGQSGLISAIVNDIGGEMVFAQQVYGYGKSGDVLIALSTSGNSANIITALKVARALDMKVIGLAGATGGQMKSLCTATICVPEMITADIQELHLPVYHLLCSMLEEEFFGME
jgi:D-sedoheptulose 7-phosphate isomerase